jgi:hypothetical protein
MTTTMLKITLITGRATTSTTWVEVVVIHLVLVRQGYFYVFKVLNGTLTGFDYD